MGVGESTADSKKATVAAADLALITGQRPGHHPGPSGHLELQVRENMPLGCKVTLRKQRMYEFMDRLVTIALPRVRDFRGLNPKSFDGRGNFALGLKEHVVFPEISYDKVDQMWGMDIIVCTTAKTDEEARALLAASTSRSGSEPGFLNARSPSQTRKPGDTDGEEKLQREEQSPRKMVARDAKKRAELKATVMDQSLSIEERFAATVKWRPFRAMARRSVSRIVAK